MPYNFSEEFVDRLLDKLGSDDAFRKQFQADPRAAVTALGHKPAPGDERDLMCLKCTRLADKDELEAARGDLRIQLLSAQASHSPIALEATRKR